MPLLKHYHISCSGKSNLLCSNVGEVYLLYIYAWVKLRDTLQFLDYNLLDYNFFFT